MSTWSTSATHPPKIPSLIGFEEIRYLDSTGLVRHRSVGDLMRYAIVNLGLDTLAHFGNFQPSAVGTAFSAEEGTRLSDEQLYALALYIYSLKPPANPNLFDERARSGQRIFQQEGCGGCHTPPLYTNNKLTPAPGFEVPDDLYRTDDIMDVCVGTDPTLATQTRRGLDSTKCPRCAACGIATGSVITGRRTRSRNGSTRQDCERIMWRKGSTTVLGRSRAMNSD
jgi:CxxC motif-containing protein (DUF1111 family)